MKAVVFDRVGSPAEVLQVRDVPVPQPGRGEVRVRMLASPINPSDLLRVRGQYGQVPTLPAGAGFEGVGIVDATGPGLLRRLRRLSPGRRVVVLNSAGGNWREYVVLSARHVVPVPEELSDEQAATFFINPASALVMVRYVLRVPPGAWLMQSAAGSALGRMVIRLGQEYGFRTLNIVRRREQAQELLRAGGDAVLCTADEALEERVPAITGVDGVRYALDAVGGATGSALVRALGHDGRLLVYGTLAGEPLTFDPRVLMTHHKTVEGFWLSHWVGRQNVLTMLGLFRRLGKLARAGILTSEVGASFPLDAIHAAVQQAELPGRQGKVLLKMGTR